MLHARNLNHRLKNHIQQKSKVSGSEFSERHKDPNKSETRLFVLSVLVLLMIMGLAFGFDVDSQRVDTA